MLNSFFCIQDVEAKEMKKMLSVNMKDTATLQRKMTTLVRSMQKGRAFNVALPYCLPDAVGNRAGPEESR